MDDGITGKCRTCKRILANAQKFPGGNSGNDYASSLTWVRLLSSDASEDLQRRIWPENSLAKPVELCVGIAWKFSWQKLDFSIQFLNFGQRWIWNNSGRKMVFLSEIKHTWRDQIVCPRACRRYPRIVHSVAKLFKNAFWTQGNFESNQKFASHDAHELAHQERWLQQKKYVN